MIFKSFDTDIDKISAKWGMFGRSFNEIGDAILGKVTSFNEEFEQTGKVLRSWNNSDSIWKRLYPSIEDITADLKDVEKLYPSLNDTDFSSKLNNLVEINGKVKSGAMTWQDYFKKLEDGEKWQIEFIQNTDLQKASIDDVKKSYDGARQSALAHNKALKQQTLGAKATTVAMKGLSMVGNILASMLISWGVSKLIEGIDNLIHAQEKLKKSAEESISAFKNSQETLQANKKTIDSISSDYKRLSKGVDDFGNNISLSAEEYSKYNEIVNQIADMFPQMVQGYTDEGNVILTLKGNVEELTKAYEASASATRQSFIATGNDIIKNIRNTDTVSDYQEIIDKLYLNDKQAIRELAQYFNDNIDKFGQKNAVVLELEKIFKEQGIEVRFNNLRADTFFTDEDVEYYLQDEIQSKLQSAIKSLTIELEGNESIAKSQGYSLLEAMLGENYTFATLPKEIQDYVKTISREFDHEFYAQFENKDDMFSYVLNNLVLPAKNGDFADVLTVAFNLETQFNNSEITVSEYQEKMSELLETIKTLPEDTQKAIKLIFGVETNEDGTTSSSVDSLINNVKNKLKGTEFDGNVSKLTLGDLQIAADLDVPPDSIESWEELLALIQKTKDEAYSSAPPDNLFTKLINSKESIDAFTKSVESSYDAYLKLLNPNVSSSDILSSIMSITGSISEMGGKLNWEFIGKNSNSLDLLGDTIEYISEKYAKSVLSGAGIDVDSKFGKMLANNIIQAQKASIQLDNLNNQIDSLQSAYDNLTDIVEQYNETGYITFDQLQTLLALEPQYLACLVDENGQLQLNQHSMLALANMRLNDAEAQAVQQAIAELEQLTLQDEKTAIEENAQAFSDAINDLSGYNTELANTIAESSIAASAIRDLNDAISGVESEGVSDEQINTVLENLETKLQLISNTRNNLANSFGNIVGSSSSKTSSTTKDTKETIDWIETKLSRIQRTISNLGKTVSATWKRWSTRNNALAQEMSAINFEIATQQQALNTYMAKANSVGLSEEYKELVRNGGFRIDEITDESTKENVKLYQEWYEKALACEDAIIDLQDSLADLAKTKFDNISKQYDDRIAMIEHHTSMLEGYVSRAEAAGFWASEVYYQKMAEKELKNINQLQGKYNDLTNALNESIANGTVELYSEQWYEIKIGIQDVESALQEANTALVEFNQTLQQIHWDLFDRGVDYKNLFIEESNFLAELISRRDLYNEVGKLTSEGQAVQGLHAVNYNAYMEQSEAFAEEIKRLNAEIANDPNDLELIDRRNELIGLQQEAIKNVMAEKDAIKDLIEEAYGAMLNSLQELIDKRKEALNAEKDLYDYQTSIQEKTDTISSYQKQLQAYSGDNSEEAKATIQKLQVSLEEAEKDLQETQYNKWLDDQQSMLDDLYDQTEEWVNTRLDNIDGLVAETIQATNDNADTIGGVITSTAETLGYNLSDYTEMLWDGDNDNTSLLLKAYEDVANGVEAGTTKLETVLNSIDGKLQSMVDDLNEQAVVESETIAQPDVVINETNHYDSGATEPQPSSSGGITFTGGTFYEDSYKGGKTGNSKSQWTGREVEVTHESGTGMVHIVDKATGTVLGWVDPDQLQGYARGTRNAKKGFHKVAENGDEIIQNNDGSVVLANGMQLYPFEGGETVYNAFETDKMLNSNLIPLDTSSFMQNIINKASIPNVSNVQNRNMTNEVHMNITLPNVTDYNSFVSQMQNVIKNDRQTQRLMQATVLDPAVGRNSLAMRRL